MRDRLGDQQPLVLAQANVVVEIACLIKLARIIDLPVVVDVRVGVKAGSLFGGIPKRIGIAIRGAAVTADFHAVENGDHHDDAILLRQSALILQAAPKGCIPLVEIGLAVDINEGDGGRLVIPTLRTGRGGETVDPQTDADVVNLVRGASLNHGRVTGRVINKVTIRYCSPAIVADEENRLAACHVTDAAIAEPPALRFDVHALGH